MAERGICYRNKLMHQKIVFNTKNLFELKNGKVIKLNGIEGRAYKVIWVS